MSTYVVTIEGTVPGIRFDGKPWTKARIEESATQSGSYTELETVTFGTPDSDPTQPQVRNFTTTKAVRSAAWFRVTFVDAEGNLQVSAAIFSTAQGSSSLCGLADVRALMQKKETDTTQDNFIESLIPRASLAIAKEAEREFAPASTAVTRTFEYPWEGGEYVSLAPYDLRSVTKVLVDTDQNAGGFELSTSEYRLWPKPARDGTYTSIRVHPLSAVTGPILWKNRELQITGNWGFTSIPADVTHATALTVVHWLNVNTAAFRRPDEQPGIQPPRKGIPTEAWELLARYRRSAIA